MKREIDKLTYKENDISFIELVYYNGSKLSVNIEKQYILAWNKEFEEYETWFLIKPPVSYFNSYISGDITLLETIQNSKVELIYRYYDDYETLSIIEEKPDLSTYNLPGKVSYLGFDFKSEYNYISQINKQVKNYNVSEKVLSSNTIKCLSSANIWDSYKSQSSPYIKKEQYVA